MPFRPIGSPFYKRFFTFTSTQKWSPGLKKKKCFYQSVRVHFLLIPKRQVLVSAPLVHEIVIISQKYLSWKLENLQPSCSFIRLMFQNLWLSLCSWVQFLMVLWGSACLLRPEHGWLKLLFIHLTSPEMGSETTGTSKNQGWEIYKQCYI